MLAEATTVPPADPYRAGLLDDRRVPRFVFGAARPGTASVVVEVVDGVESPASIADGTIAAGPDGSLFDAVELAGAANAALVSSQPLGIL